jgi:hypothetical protein
MRIATIGSSYRWQDAQRVCHRYILLGLRHLHNGHASVLIELPEKEPAFERINAADVVQLRSLPTLFRKRRAIKLNFAKMLIEGSLKQLSGFTVSMNVRKRNFNIPEMQFYNPPAYVHLVVQLRVGLDAGSRTTR